MEKKKTRRKAVEWKNSRRLAVDLYLKQKDPQNNILSMPELAVKPHQGYVDRIREVIHTAPPTPFKDVRILMLLDQFNIGGTETYTLSVTRDLLRRGIHVVVAGKRGKMLDAFSALGCPVYEIGFVTDKYELNVKEEEENVEQLKRIIQAENISLVHIHQFPSGSQGMKACEQLSVPVVITVHGTYYEPALFKLLDRCFAIIGVSPGIYNDLRSKQIECRLIPNGIEHKLYEHRSLLGFGIRKSLGITDASPIITYAARLSWEKGSICKDIIEASGKLRKEKFPDLKLLILGDGHDLDELKKLVDHHNKEAQQRYIHVMGNVQNMAAYFSVSDCTIGTGRIALEAMACECPVLAIGVKGYFGPVLPGRYASAWETWFGDHGAVAGSIDQLSSDIEMILSMPHKRKNEWNWLSRKFIRNYFAINRTSEQLWDVYQKVLESQGDRDIGILRNDNDKPLEWWH